jgi:DNA ligase D-like protein (predicted 3'-phosphoesterase)
MWSIALICVLLVGEIEAMPSKKRSLTQYQEKRDFGVTPEPKGKKKAKKTKEPIFVIQKHDATSLHYDIRLEVDGVLVSWAVPKGPSLNPTVKHLAIMTEDHPMEYADFEGVIPEGEYGAGPVMVWDVGTYKNVKEKNGKQVPMSTCLKEGHVKVFLEGEKIKGSFAFIKTHYQDKENQWLLVKEKDEYASKKKNPVRSQQKSVLTGRTMAQIKKEG